MSDVVLTGGTVLTPQGPEDGDVRIAAGAVAEIGTNLDGAAVIDCSGTWIGPGFVDLHTHLREPGHEWKEDIGSGSAAAAAGGYTAVVAMPNTDPPTDAGHLARYIADRGRRTGLVEVVPAGTVSLGRQGEKLAHLDELSDAGVTVFTDDGDVVADAGLMRQALDYLAGRDGIVAQHAVDTGLSRGGSMHEGAVSSRLGMYGIPAAAETVIIARDLELVELTGGRYHVQHVSTAGAVAMIAEAKGRGLRVTAEVTPHHLMFDDTALRAADPTYKMMPPLRSSEDRSALVSGLQSGVIDAVATDHAPHAAHETDVPFEHAPNGVIGLEWAAAVVNTIAGLDMVAFFDRMAEAPARIAGIAGHGARVAPGIPANLVVFDPSVEWVPSDTVSQSTNAPYFGVPLQGRALVTIFRGEVTARTGSVPTEVS